jgi:hypothetical protein
MEILAAAILNSNCSVTASFSLIEDEKRLTEIPKGMQVGLAVKDSHGKNVRLLGLTHNTFNKKITDFDTKEYRIIAPKDKSTHFTVMFKNLTPAVKYTVEIYILDMESGNKFASSNINVTTAQIAKSRI